MISVFLGGTIGNNPWREKLIAELQGFGYDTSSFFNPVKGLGEWSEKDQRDEERHKVEDDYLLFFLTEPMQEGNPISAYSMVEAVMALYDRPDSTVVVVDHAAVVDEKFRIAMEQTEAILRKRFPDAKIFGSYNDLVYWLISRLS